MRGLRLDLVEPRRRMRSVFTVILGVEILTVLRMELWLGGAAASRELELFKSVSALALTLAVGAWVFVPRRIRCARREATTSDGRHSEVGGVRRELA